MPLRKKGKPRGKGRPFLPGAANPGFGLGPHNRNANRNANVLRMPVAGQIEKIELAEPMDMALSVESKRVGKSVGEQPELPDGYGREQLRCLMLEKYGPNSLRILLLPDEPDESEAEIGWSKHFETSCAFCSTPD